MPSEAAKQSWVNRLRNRGALQRVICNFEGENILISFATTSLSIAQIPLARIVIQN
jgi:hypothetical protein